MNTTNPLAQKIDTVLTVLLALIIIVAPSQYSFAIGSKSTSIAHISIADPLIWLTAGVWFIQQLLLLKSKQKTLKELFPPLENIAFVILVSVSIINAENLKESLKEIFQITEYTIVAFLVFYRSTISNKTLQFYRFLILITCSLVVCYGVIQYFMPSIEFMKVRSTFGNRNVYGGYLAIILPFVLSWLIHAKTWKLKVWTGLVLVAGLITLLAGGSLLALLIATAVICALNSGKTVWIWGAATLCCLLLVMPFLPRKNLQVMIESVNLYGVHNEELQVSPRYIEWQASIQVMDEKPVLGVGIGNYQKQIGTYYGFLPIPEGGKEHDHNNLFLVFLVSTGIIGLTALIFLISAWLQRLIILLRQNLSPIQTQLTQAAIGALIAFCINSIWSALLVRGVFLCLIIIISLALVSRNRPVEA